MTSFLFIVCAFLGPSYVLSTMLECNGGFECFDVPANDLVFNCYRAGSGSKSVMLLHGFPMYAVYWENLMQYWLDNSSSDISAVACHLRGYSPNASPTTATEYAYDVMAADVYPIADFFNMTSFHLVGHDHGAGLGWVVAANNSHDRLLSYTALAVYHLDAWSKDLAGADADPAKVLVSNYFNQFRIHDSATINDRALWLNTGGGFGAFTSEASFQAALWWYHANLPKFVAAPEVVNDTVAQSASQLVSIARSAIPLAPRPGIAQETAVGSVEIPTLFVCGVNDPYTLCTRTDTASYVSARYQYAEFDCGHDILKDDCDNDTVRAEAMETITNFIHNPSGPASTASPPLSTILPSLALALWHLF